MRWWSGGRMDDLALLDLLECPVCFERLDGTAKVLPCQHTFCKPCLQQISHSHKEVRCPECRSPVTGSIDDLPVNLLLVRLLDGIKYGQTNARVTPPQTAQPPADQHQGNQHLEPVKSHSGLVKTLSPAHSPLEQVPCARALYTYSGQKPGDLSFRKGDIILLHQQVDENWFYGEISGACGIFPLGFVHVIHHLPQPPPLCKALYDFTLQETEQPVIKNILPFVKNNILKVIRRVDENWAEGKLGERVGIFPISFVEMNSTAKQLLSVKRVDVKSVQSHSSPTGNPRVSLTHAETGNPHMTLTHAETGNPHMTLTHAETGNPRVSLTHAETGNPHMTLTHAETGNPRVSLTHEETGNPRVSLTHAEMGNPRVSLTHAETGNPRVSLTHAETGNPRVSLTHTETGNPRVSLTHVQTGNPRVSLTHTETGNPRVSLTHAETGNPRVSLTHAETGNPRVSLTHAETGNPRVSLTHTETGNPRVSLTHAETGNPRVSLTHVQTGNPRVSLTHAETGNPRVSLTHAETGNPRVSLTHTETGNPRVSLTHAETGNPRVSLTHAETGNPRVSLTHTETGNPHVSLTHTQTGNPCVSLTHVQTGNPRVALTHTQTGKTGSKESRCHANAVNTLTRMCQPPPSRRSLHISLPVLISSSNPAVLAQITERRATPTQMLHGMLEVGVCAPGTRTSSSQYHPEMGHPRTQVPRPAAGVTEMTGPHRALVPASGQEEAMVGITLPSRTGPYGQQDAVTSPPRLSGGSLARHVDGTGYRPNVHRPTLAVPPVRSQNSNGRCVPAVVIQAQPYSSRQLPQRADSHTDHSSPLASTCTPSLPTRPVPTRPVPTTAPPPPPPRAVRQVQQPFTAPPGGITAPTSTPTHANNQDRSCLNKAGCGPGASLPPSWFTTPRLQLTTTSPKPEQAREEDASHKTQAPVSHSRAASCPITSQEKVEVVHQKTGSWDSCYPCTPPSPPHSSTVEEQPVPAPTPSTCFNRCRAVLWLPARGAAEPALEPGDVMLVHGRRPDGCYQDNRTERGNTGLFTGNDVGVLR